MTQPARLVLKPTRQRSVLRLHPWIFSGAVARTDGDPQPGDSVLVCADDGTALGWAAYSPQSQIRARMWTYSADEPFTGDMIAQRVLAAHARRAGLWKQTNSARIVFSEADGLPGLIADQYGETVVMQLTTVGVERWRNEIVHSLAALPGVVSVFERSDADIREREGLGPQVGLVSGPLPPPEVITTEHQWRFSVDVHGGHKTGFYLDQRHARSMIGELAAGRSMLNVFSYTGAFSVIAAASGATNITNIDSSAPALATAGRNAILNSVDVGELLDADAFTALRGLRDRAKNYDLIVLDPPKFAATERQIDKATRAYKDLNLLALKLLNPGGLLLTFSCSGAMTMDLFQKVIAGAALDAKRQASIIDRLHQPEDHPVPLPFPEAEYLKGLLVRVD